jgi:hypothetical protein|tara:strand:- start:668 stop:838 length:171 start_codon:yes stop_codon:yes gene_type:complete
MDTEKWRSVAIRKEIVKIAEDIGKRTERSTSNVFAFAIKRLHDDVKKGRVEELPKT